MATGIYVDNLLAQYRGSASPWLTWYADNGERIELSGRVFDNWVAKSANLLQETFDLEPGQIVVLDMTAHWKSLVLSLAALHLGAQLTSPDAAGAQQASLWITAEPTDERIPGAAEILAVNPAALALSFDGDLGPVAEDYNASVRSFADQFYPAPIDGASTALNTPPTALTFAQLFADDHRTARGTILVKAAGSALDLLPYLLGQWAQGDAVVLVQDGMDVSERLRSGEKITYDYIPGN